MTTYKCPSGILTIGYGHTANVRPNMKITKRQAFRLLQHDFKLAGKVVDHHVRVKLSQQQRYALASFVFNVGPGAFKQSSVLQYVNQKRFFDAALVLQKYIHDSQGRPLEGLRRRRLYETSLLLNV